MPSTFDTQFAAAFCARWLEQFVETIIYTPKTTGGGASPRTIQAQLTNRRPIFDDAQTYIGEAVNVELYALSDVLGVSNPTDRHAGGGMDTFTWAGLTWNVISVRNRDTGGMHQLLASTNGLADPGG